MRRSDLLLKIISFTAFLAVAVYIGFYLYNARVNPLRTVLAVRASASESAPAEGYAVREEQLITGSGSGAYVVAGEGQKLSAGGRAAVAYSDRSAAERSARILELQLRLDALNGLLGGMTVSEAASATVTDLACAVRSGDFSDLTELRARTDTYIFGDTITRTSEEIRGEIAAIEEQLADAAGRDTAGASYVTVPAAGVFSGSSDGFERVSPSDLDGLTCRKLEDLFRSPDRVPAGTVGRLVTGLRWYFAASLPADDAGRLKGLGSVKVAFSKTWSRTVPMRVEYVGENENGLRAVVLSSEAYLYETASLRQLYGDVIFSEAEGVRAPREALHLSEDGQTFVYVLVGLRAERANVRIVYEGPDYYIVQPESGSRLSEGAQIIVSSGDIYDGKVIQ